MFGRHGFKFKHGGFKGEFRRMRRGDIKFHLLEILKETPRHGYEIISELETRSGGYRPSPGSVYPTLQMLEEGATHIGVATDHIIESFRNELWPGYKTGEGIEPALYAQFVPLEEARVAMGVATWPMVDLEADYALAEAGIMTVKRLVNCGAIQQSRLRLIVSPLRVVRGVGSPCRVVAVEGE